MVDKQGENMFNNSMKKYLQKIDSDPTIYKAFMVAFYQGILDILTSNNLGTNVRMILKDLENTDKNCYNNLYNSFVSIKNSITNKKFRNNLIFFGRSFQTKTGETILDKLCKMREIFNFQEIIELLKNTEFDFNQDGMEKFIKPLEDHIQNKDHTQ